MRIAQTLTSLALLGTLARPAASAGPPDPAHSAVPRYVRVVGTWQGIPDPTGSYTVNADCTAEDILVNQLTGAFNTQELIPIDHGKEFLFVVTTAGAPPIVSGMGRKLSRGESDRDQ